MSTDATAYPTIAIVMAYHGYPWLIHRLTYRRTNHHNLHVRGYKEEGAATTTTPSTCSWSTTWTASTSSWTPIDQIPGLGRRAAVLCKQMVDKRADHRAYVRRTGEDLPEIRDWAWTGTP